MLSERLAAGAGDARGRRADHRQTEDLDMAEAENEEDRGLLDDDDGGGANENAALFLVGTMWIIDNRGRRKVCTEGTPRLAANTLGCLLFSLRTIPYLL